MADRPEGDHLDQLLRRGISALAESAGPDESDAMVHQLTPLESRRRQNRGGFLALAACLVLAVVGLTWWISRDAPSALDVAGDVEVEDADPWTVFLARGESDDHVRCLVEWNLNRDLFFRIPGDQFAASTSVSSFPVDTPSAIRWLDRYEPGFQILAAVAASDEQMAAIAEVIAVFEATRAQAADSSRVDIAPAILAASNRLETVFTHDQECPLGPANEGRPVHEALVELSAGDVQPMATGVACVDAELQRLGGEINDIARDAWLSNGPLGEADLAGWRSANRTCPFAEAGW